MKGNIEKICKEDLIFRKIYGRLSQSRDFFDEDFPNTDMHKLQGVPSQMIFKESIYLSFWAEYLYSKNYSGKVFLLQFLYAKD